MNRNWLIILFIIPFQLAAQEGVLNDLKSCPSFYWWGNFVAKEIKKNNDSALYFYDPELVIYFNRKSKNLNPNRFYIFNHGLNKLLTFKIMELEVEITGPDDVKRIVEFSANDLKLLYNDSIQRCSWVIGGVIVNVPGYNDINILSVKTAIQYYGQTRYKWFAKEK